MTTPELHITEAGEKPELEHVESVKPDVPANGGTFGYDEAGLVKSRFDDLSVPRTAWVFKRAVFYALCVYTGYMCEGFEVSIIVAQARACGNERLPSLEQEEVLWQTPASSKSLAPEQTSLVFVRLTPPGVSPLSKTDSGSNGG